MKPNIKKLLILNAPYLLFVYLFDKVGQAVRLSPGAGLSGKLLSIGSGFSAAFSNVTTNKGYVGVILLSTGNQGSPSSPSEWLLPAVVWAGKAQL